MKGQVNEVGGGEENFGWGWSWSPLVDGDNLVIAPGGPDGLLAVLKKDTGALVWRTATVTEQATYTSPIKATIGGIAQYIYVAQEKVYGVDAKFGGVLWTYEKEKPTEEIVAPTPIYHDGHVFITCSKGAAELIKVDKVGAGFAVSNDYVNKKFANFHGGVVLVDGCVYGSNELRDWKCVDFASGTEQWASTALGPGALTCADGLLYCVSQDAGAVALVEPSPKGYKEISRFTLPAKSKLRKVNARLWTHPVVANGCLYLRDQELVFCYKVK
jgi:outer membrane protein assembly factor BamB